MDDAYLKRADSLIELAINAKDLYNSASPRERLKLLTELSSNRQLGVLVGARAKYSLRKEALHGLYRIKGNRTAARILIRMTDQMALSQIPEIKTLRRTLMKWRNEILNYFVNRITNARTEGFNNVAKLIQKRAYGVKSFKLYRLRYLNACA
jgi:transposase